jgi:multidrug efflux pump
VLLVSFFSLGLRTGLVVAVTIPLVLAMTFALMHYFGIGLHKISLGALVLALGLLVDDAIIAVEMMAVKIEQGFSPLRAAPSPTRARPSRCSPARSSPRPASCRSPPRNRAPANTRVRIFQVVTIALIVSWVAAVLFIPYLGNRLLPGRRPSSCAHAARRHDASYDTRFYRRLRDVIEWCLAHRRRTGSAGDDPGC